MLLLLLLNNKKNIGTKKKICKNLFLYRPNKKKLSVKAQTHYKDITGNV